ncbi:unnamed protein product [Miscanthus lutarioriparius]|uniref:Uncharacterized protein n=1 Tax=Miscanthus lutarioriparius TaxID=422564 RepID=A0A811SMD7_9POAL|nr:unnamed protein product [Miscanthus lutarioriparius]
MGIGAAAAGTMLSDLAFRPSLYGIKFADARSAVEPPYPPLSPTTAETDAPYMPLIMIIRQGTSQPSEQKKSRKDKGGERREREEGERRNRTPAGAGLQRRRRFSAVEVGWQLRCRAVGQSEREGAGQRRDGGRAVCSGLGSSEEEARGEQRCQSRKQRRGGGRGKAKQDAGEGAWPLTAPSGRGERGSLPRAEVQSRAAAAVWSRAEMGRGRGEWRWSGRGGAQARGEDGELRWPPFIGAAGRCAAADIFRPRRSLPARVAGDSGSGAVASGARQGDSWGGVA